MPCLHLASTEVHVVYTNSNNRSNLITWRLIRNHPWRHFLYVGVKIISRGSLKIVTDTMYIFETHTAGTRVNREFIASKN